MATAVFEPRDRWVAVVIGAITKLDPRNQTADSFAQKPKLAISPFEQWTRAVAFRAAKPFQRLSDSIILNQDRPLRIRRPDSSQRITHHLRVQQRWRKVDGLPLLGVRGIERTTRCELADRPQLALGVNREIAARREFQMVHGSIQVNACQAVV